MPDKTTARPKRGQRGYCKYKNGLFNVTPKGKEEIAISKRNASESPLLRLPPEIRNMIWEYALGGSIIRLRTEMFFNPLSEAPPTDRFIALRVCRQIYAEAATVPYTSNTFTFGYDVDLKRFEKSAQGTLTNHMSRIYVGAFPSSFKTAQGCRNTFLLESLTSLKEIEIAVWCLGGKIQPGEKALATGHFKDLSVTLHWDRDYKEWRSRWLAL